MTILYRSIFILPSIMNQFKRYLSELFFPESCMHCGEKTKIENNIALCFSCELQLEPAWEKEAQNKFLIDRFKGLVQLENAFVQYYFTLSGVSQSLIHEAKYNKQTNILKHYGYVMGKKLSVNTAFKTTPDLVVPIPNNWRKKLKIGYNQAAIYAQEIASGLEIKHETTILKKRHDSTSQTKRNKLQRFEHLSNLYYLKNSSKIKGKHILLVDDVVTSGATIETCTSLFIKAGAAKVSVLAFMLVK